MTVLPPGNILQYMYVKRRIRRLSPGRFLEIGSGKGNLSRVLLKAGHTGVGVDLNPTACEKNRIRNADYIANGHYAVHHGDFLEQGLEPNSFDLVISAMVVEHIPHDELKGFVAGIKRLLKPGGTLILLVPSGMRYWGIEDEIAGHIMRYERADFEDFGQTHELKLQHLAGLTYPLSNWLKGLSDTLVKRAEEDVLDKSQKERTIYTGDREVQYKTEFPAYLGLVLNPVVMYPFYILQLLNLKSPKAMVLLAEFTKP